ncbi:hypothetical protein ACWDBW_00915 [Streptomyces sp. NPDC001107]
MIAAVGYAELTPDMLTVVEADLRAVLERLPEGVPGLVRAGAGVPVAFARAVRASGRELIVVAPTQGMVPALLPRRDRMAVGELLALAQQVRLLEFDPGDRDACIGADERMILGCRQVLAVWDGSPSNGRDATAHLVAYARARGIPLTAVPPPDAGPGGGPGPERPGHDRRPHSGEDRRTIASARPIHTTHEAATPR